MGGGDWTRVAEAAPAAMLAVDGQGHVVGVNRAGEELFGCGRGKIAGRPLGEILEGDRVSGGWSPGLARCCRRDVPVEVFVVDAGVGPAVATVFVKPVEPAPAAVPAAPARQALELAEELAGMGTWDVDLRSGHRAWSKQLYRMLGLEPRNGTLSHDTLLGVMHPDDRERVGRLIESAVTAPERFPRDGVALELRMLAADGSVRRMRARGRIQHDRSGRPLRWTGAVQDITQPRAIEQELEAHHALVGALDDWVSFQESAPVLLERVGTALELPIGSLWLPDPEHGRLARRASWSAAPERFASAEGRVETGPELAWRTRAPVVTPDLARGPRSALHDAALAHGLVSALAVPAVDRGEAVAVLALYGRERRVETATLAPTLGAIGRELGRFLAARRAELGPRRLSERELEVLRHAAEGRGAVEAARALGVAPATVKSHLQSAYVKLGVSDRAAAVALALRSGLID